MSDLDRRRRTIRGWVDAACICEEHLRLLVLEVCSFATVGAISNEERDDALAYAATRFTKPDGSDRELVDKIVAWWSRHGARTGRYFRKDIELVLVSDGCESPIEQALYDALIGDGLTPKVQFGVGQYRVDMAFPDERVVVECDGHEFHERTKEQAASDKLRDRKLQIAGWAVLRFTGSQIHRDVGSCVSDVREMIASRSRVAS